MKRISGILCAILALSLLLAPMALAAGEPECPVCHRACEAVSNRNGTHRWVCGTADCANCGQTVAASEACGGGTATCTEAAVCEVCGAAYGKPAGHKMMELSRSVTLIYERCRVCGSQRQTDNPYSENLMPGLVRDADSGRADYAAGVSRESGRKILTVTALRGGSAALFLKQDYITLWRREDVDILRFRTDGAVLEIGLKAVGADWFAPGPAVDGVTYNYYVFALEPVEGGAQVAVTARYGEAETPAAAIREVTLYLEGAALPVTANGVYLTRIQ